MMTKLEEIKSIIIEYFNGDSDKLQEVRNIIGELSPFRAMPIDNVRWVPLKKVVANDYNPNAVPRREMALLYRSIKEDGLTQPIVTFHDSENDKYIIVDGFHRYTVLRMHSDLLKTTHGKVPVVVIDKPLVERMASTVRHNRARGKHSVAGMANLVFKMLEEGVSDEEVCRKLGLTSEELVRIKYVTGFAKLYEGAEFSRAWELGKMTRARVKAEREGEQKIYAKGSNSEKD